MSCNFLSSIKAQDEYRAPLPTIIPMSPNAAAMAQYVDYPVSHYTGVPNVNIPLHEVDIYGYKLPITLSYHASGIKVSQEASWVGLGWSLNMGGSITRTVKGTDDLYLTTQNGIIMEGYYKGPEVAGNDIIPPYNTGERNLFFDTGWGGIKQLADSEPDIFYYSFPGGSGKFVIDKTRGPLLFDKSNNIKIEVLNHYTSVQRGWYFAITTPDGTKYIFDKEEKTVVYSQNNKFLNKNYTVLNSASDCNIQSHYSDDYVTGWSLTKIILPNKKEILFTYENEYITSPAQESLRIYYDINGLKKNIFQTDCSYAVGERYSTSKSSNDSHRLSKILWEGGYIDFTPCDRMDINGSAKALRYIKLYDKSNILIKQFNFEYSYFNDSYFNAQDEYVYLRLKLNSVFESKTSFVGSIPPYKFSYFEGAMPAKNSKNTDYWGYFNNGKYGANYCAKVNYWPNNLNGVLKNSNLQYLKIGTLNKITLPTGGDITYEFEENTFNNSAWASDNTKSGAGLRVKRIISEAKTRNFTYIGGKLLVEPVLYALDVVCPGGGRYRSFNCVVQLSEPKLPLSSLTSGNIIGYDQVEEYISDGSNTSKTRYEYYNDPEEEWYEEVRHDFPTHPNYYNGLPKKITSYANNIIVEQTEYEYKQIQSQRVEAFRWDPLHFASYNYHYQATWVQKAREIVHVKSQNQNLELLNDQQYNYNNYFQLSSIKSIIDASTNESKEQITYYITDFTDNISKAMVNAHHIGVPVETIGLRDGLVVTGKKTLYKQINNMFLPDVVYILDTDAPKTKENYKSYYNPKLYFDIYNDYGKISQVRDNNISIVYLWGYNSQYPIAEIKNATYQDISTAMGGTTVIKNIENKTIPSVEDWIKINSLREHSLLRNSSISIYKYKPMVGTTEVVDPRKVSIYYEYDSFGNLVETYMYEENNTKSIIGSYQYIYNNK